MLKLCLRIIFLLSFTSNSAYADSRIKDIVSFEGIRDNMLVGYGLVVGLNGTGDNLNNTAFTQKGLTDFLEKLGVNTRGANLKTKNIAAVMVTAKLPPFTRQGSKIDVAVSTLGDSKSLQGGTLLATTLLGADGEVYAVAQGQLAIGGFQAIGKSGTTVNKGVATNGFIASGAIIEKEIDFNFASLNSLKIALHNPDLTTALGIANKINNSLKNSIAKATDPGTVELSIPANYSGNVVELLAKIEQLSISVDSKAKIIIDEASGTIVMGENVRISPIAIAQGNLTITISENDRVSQPGAFAPETAQTVVTPQSTVSIEENRGMKMTELVSNTSLSDLVKGLNALGVGPRDLITILQNIKAAGAMQAEIEAR